MTLSARIKACGTDRDKVLAVLKGNLQSAHANLKANFEHGNIGGLKAASTISAFHDAIVIPLFNYAAGSLFPGPDDQLSLCAIGGYGRGEMAPYSDLDLLFLCAPNKDNERCKNITEYVLYMLWDLGLKIGHANRSPAQCIELAKTDETVLTSLLDLRRLAGAEEPSLILNALLSKERSRAKKRNFIAAKLGARDGRHVSAGNSRYVIEPNVKEGKGGLRDLHTLYWIAKFIHGGHDGEASRKPHNVSAYMRLDLFGPRASKRFTDAAEFLWRVRIHSHLLAGRAAEVLSFDRQDGLAVRMGFSQETPEERVENFMRAYFMTAREVGALTRIACSKLEAQSALLLPQGLFSFLPARSRGLKEAGFILDHGRLSFTSAVALKKDPLAILRLFAVAGRRNLDIHPDAFALIVKNLSVIDDNFRADPKAAKVFFAILLDSKAPGALLRLMNDASVLGAYLPEFGSIVARTQFNMHHAYTVDDHTISLIMYLHDLEKGKLTREHPLSSQFLKNWDERMRRMVYLACLFHDVGKSESDQCEDGARMAAAACTRLGLPDTEIETISWLVRHHLDMSETAQRRDISNPQTVEKFARMAGSITRLQMLTALTVVDIRAVGPGIWNDWKGELLRQLYAAAKQALMDGAGKKQPSKIEQMLIALPGAKGKEHYVTTKLDRPKDIAELYVVTCDRPSLFADLAGAIASQGATVIGARLHTETSGQVFNVFYLQNTEGLAFGRKNQARLHALEAKTLSAAKGALETYAPAPAQLSSRARAIPIRPRVSIFSGGDDIVIIEVEGRDRLGLLYELAIVLAAHSLSIRSAHIEVAGPKAVDVFYVSGGEEQSLQKSGLRDELLGALEKTPA